MPLTSVSTVATGDTITAATQNTMRDNDLVLDGRTGGDPGAADKWLVSSGSTTAAWVARATAVLAALGYTPLNPAGGEMSGDLTLANFIALKGEETGGSARNLAYMSNANVATFGDANVNGAIVTASLAVPASTTIGGNTPWTNSNFNPGNKSDVGHSHDAATIDAGAVGTDELAALAVTGAKMATGAVSEAGKIADGIITLAKMAAAASDAAAGTASLRSLGTGATEAAAGNHEHTAQVTSANGTYTGNDTGSRVISNSLGWQPRLVMIQIGSIGQAMANRGGHFVGFNTSTGNVFSGGTGSLDASGFTVPSGLNLSTAGTYTWTAIA